MYKCNCCNREFDKPKKDTELMGEAYGRPAYRAVDLCPFCDSDDFEESKYEDVYGDYIYKDDCYYEFDYALVHEDNLGQFLLDCKRFG